MMKRMDLMIEEFKNALLQINRIKAAKVFERCYKEENSFAMLEQLTIQTLENIGAGWENGTISLSQVYMSGVICEQLIEEYMPKLDIKRTNAPHMAIAVLQDHHALGKRIVYSILRAGGFELLDFGHGQTVEEVVQKTLENKVEVLLISTLMLSSAMKVKQVKEKLTAMGSKTKIIVGGAPFRLDPTLWKSVGADLDGKDASNVIKAIEQIMKGDKAI